MPSRIWRDRRVVSVAAILLLISIAGVSLYIVLFWGENLSFRTISQAEEGNWDYRPQGPALMIIATAGEVNDAANVLMASRDMRIIEQLRQVDYDHEFAVLVFQGDEPTSDYGIAVQQVQRRGSLVIIRAKFTQASASGAHVQIITSPYHFVAVTRVSVWSERVTFRLMDGLREVAEARQVIP